MNHPSWNYGTSENPVTVANQKPTVTNMNTGATIPQTIVTPTNYTNRDTSIIGQELKIAQDQGLTGQNAADQARILNAQKIAITPTSGVATQPSGATTTIQPQITPKAGVSTTQVSPTTAQTSTQAGLTQAGIIDDASFQSVLRSIDPNWLYTNEQKASLKDALSKWYQGVWLETASAEQKMNAYKNLADAWRVQRNIVDQLDQTNIMNQRQVQDLTRQYSQAIDNQKQRMEADANNTSIMQGSSGRLQSRNMMNGVRQVLDNNTKVYNDLVSQQDVMTKRLAEDLDMATKTLSKAYNDAVSQDMQEALKWINALDTTGQMNTKAGLLQARSYIDGILQKNLQNLTNYYGGLQTINKQYQEYHQEYLDQQKIAREEEQGRKTIDVDITNNNSDGYAYNKYGERVMWSSGLPVTYTANKPIQNVIDNGDGTSTFIYKNGTYETRQLGATIGQEAAQWYAQMLSSGRLSIDDVPASIRSHVVQMASQMPQAGQWDYQNITQDGETRTVKVNKVTGETQEIGWGAVWGGGMPINMNGTHDLRSMASQYPREASLKNNNPAGLTWGISQQLKDLLINAGVQFGEGGKRPEWEGGNYIAFPTIEDGLKAYQIALAGRGGDIYNKLYNWSAGGDKNTPEATKIANKTSYANGLMQQAGIERGTKFESLSPDKLATLMRLQMQRESPGLAKILASPEFNQPAQPNATEAKLKLSSLPLYRKYIEEWALPSKDALKWLGMTSEQFTSSADEWYNQFLRQKENEINSAYPTLNIEFTPSYNGISATQKEKLNESMTKIWDIDQRIEQLKTLFEKYGTEVFPTKAKSEMETLRKQIILKAKEVENLWVLNGPDLWILEDLLPNTTWFISWISSFDENTLAKLNNIQNNYRSDAKTKWINYWAKISFKDAQSWQDIWSEEKSWTGVWSEAPIKMTSASGKAFNIDLSSTGWLQQDDHDEIDSLMQ